MRHAWISLLVFGLVHLAVALTAQTADARDVAEIARLCDGRQQDAMRVGTVVDMEGVPQTIRSDSAQISAAYLIGEPVASVRRLFDKWAAVERRTDALGTIARFYTCVAEIRLRQLENRPTTQSSRTGTGANPPVVSAPAIGASAANPPRASGNPGPLNYADPNTYDAATRAMFEQEMRDDTKSERAQHEAQWQGIGDPLAGDNYLRKLVTMDAGGVAGELALVGNGNNATAIYRRKLLQTRNAQLQRPTPASSPAALASASSGRAAAACAQATAVTRPDIDLAPPPTDPATINYTTWVTVGGPAFETSCRDQRIRMLIAWALACRTDGVVVADAGTYYRIATRLTTVPEVEARIEAIRQRRASPRPGWTVEEARTDDFEECVLTTRKGQL